jgi:hypothetical protein
MCDDRAWLVYGACLGDNRCLVALSRLSYHYDHYDRTRAFTSVGALERRSQDGYYQRLLMTRWVTCPCQLISAS